MSRAPLAVQEYGREQDPSVLVLHGLTEAGSTWPDLVAHWAGRRRLIAPDLRGHGASPRFAADELGCATEVMLTDVLGLLDARPAPVVVMGHSLGGLLALRAALAPPAAVSALVLEDPARPHGGTAPDPGFVAGTEAFLDTMADPGPEIARMGRETSWSEAEILAWAACKGQVDREYVRAGLRLGDGAWEELFTALTVPTLLVLPPRAGMAPRPELVHNPLLRTVVIPGTGHCVRRDRPEAFHHAVDAFLADVGA